MKYLTPHEHHVDAWLNQKIKVVETDAPVADSRYQATLGDYDLDCAVGYGRTADEAKEDLCCAINIWYVP